MIRLGAMLSSWLGQRLELPPHRAEDPGRLRRRGRHGGDLQRPDRRRAVRHGGDPRQLRPGDLRPDRRLLGDRHPHRPLADGQRAALRRARVRACQRLGDAPLRWSRGRSAPSPRSLFMFGVRASAEPFDRAELPAAAAAAARGPDPAGRHRRSGFPHVLGRGYGGINLALAGKLRLRRALRPAAGAHRPAAAARPGQAGRDRADLGSGGAGGMFTPSLVFGAMVGGAYGVVHARAVAVHRLALRRLRRGGHGGGRGRHQPRADQRHPHPLRVHRQLRPHPAADGGRRSPSSLLARALHRYSIYTESLRRSGIESCAWRRRCSPASRRRA